MLAQHRVGRFALGINMLGKNKKTISFDKCSDKMIYLVTQLKKKTKKII